MAYNSSYAYVLQSIGLSSVQPEITWHSEGVLKTPKLLYPENGEKVCPAALQVGDVVSDHPYVMWAPVDFATYYILQWCLNDSFSGPTLGGIKIDASLPNSNIYIFTDPPQLIQGIQIFWRVFAIDNAGKVSDKSPSRSFTYDCKSGKGDGSGEPHPDNLCNAYGIQLEMAGDTTMECQGWEQYFLKFSFPCSDPCGATLITPTNVIWQWFGDFTDNCIMIEPKVDDIAYPPLRAIVRSNCCESQEFLLRAQVFFYDAKKDTTFSCFVDKRIVADCDAKTRELARLPCDVYVPRPEQVVEELPEIAPSGTFASWLSQMHVTNVELGSLPDQPYIPYVECKSDGYYTHCNLADFYALNSLYLGCGLYFSPVYNEYAPGYYLPYVGISHYQDLFFLGGQDNGPSGYEVFTTLFPAYVTYTYGSDLYRECGVAALCDVMAAVVELDYTTKLFGYGRFSESDYDCGYSSPCGLLRDSVAITAFPPVYHGNYLLRRLDGDLGGACPEWARLDICELIDDFAVSDVGAAATDYFLTLSPVGQCPQWEPLKICTFLSQLEHRTDLGYVVGMNSAFTYCGIFPATSGYDPCAAMQSWPVDTSLSDCAELSVPAICTPSPGVGGDPACILTTPCALLQTLPGADSVTATFLRNDCTFVAVDAGSSACDLLIAQAISSISGATNGDKFLPYVFYQDYAFYCGFAPLLTGCECPP